MNTGAMGTELTWWLEKDVPGASSVLWAVPAVGWGTRGRQGLGWAVLGGSEGFSVLSRQFMS